MEMEVLKREAEQKADLFFEIQAKIDRADPYFHEMEGLIGNVTSTIEIYREFRRHVDIGEVQNFYRHIKQICENIIECLSKAEAELRRRG